VPKRWAKTIRKASPVGDGSKPDFLPEQNRTDYSVKWLRIGGPVNFGE